jgi:hypothetical protein
MCVMRDSQINLRCVYRIRVRQITSKAWFYQEFIIELAL